MHWQPKMGWWKAREHNEKSNTRIDVLQNRKKRRASERKAPIADHSCCRFDKTNGDNVYLTLFRGQCRPFKSDTVIECYSTQKLLCHPKQILNKNTLIFDDAIKCYRLPV